MYPLEGNLIKSSFHLFKKKCAREEGISRLVVFKASLGRFSASGSGFRVNPQTRRSSRKFPAPCRLTSTITSRFFTGDVSAAGGCDYERKCAFSLEYISRNSSSVVISKITLTRSYSSLMKTNYVLITFNYVIRSTCVRHKLNSISS